MSQVMDKIESSVTFDDSGNLPRQENGERVPPAAEPKPAENTDATKPSPDPAAPPASVENKANAAITEPKPGTITPKASVLDESKLSDDELAALKERHAKPEDKGDEWQIRAYREGQKTRKQLEPIADVMDRIGSPDRTRRGLELTAELADPQTPIAKAWSKMTALSESRAQELVNYLYDDAIDNYPDQTATDLIGEKATVAELKEGLKLLRSGTKGADAPPQPGTTTVDVQKPADMSDEDWSDFKLDFPKAYEAMQQQQAALAEAQKSKTLVDPEPTPAEKELKTLRDEKQQQEMAKGWDEIKTEYGKLYDSAFSVVDDGLRDLGLVPDPAKDDEKTQKLKSKTAERIQEAVYLEFEGPNGPNRTKNDPEGNDDWTLCTDEQKLNRSLVKNVHKFMLNKDFKAANDYLDRIKAQVDLAFQRASESELDIYNAAMMARSANSTRDPATTYKRPETIGGTAPGALTPNKTPWLDQGYRQQGETSHQAMMRFWEENPNFKAA